MYILNKPTQSIHRVKEIIANTRKQIIIKAEGLTGSKTIKHNNAKSDQVLFQNKPRIW